MSSAGRFEKLYSIGFVIISKKFICNYILYKIILFKTRKLKSVLWITYPNKPDQLICGIARFVISLSQNPAYTTATQWLERTLDDSSNRRLAIPEAFLGVDAILNLLAHVLSSLTTSPQIALQRLKEETPFLTMENILMASVNKGGDRQALHEKLRQISLAARKKKDPLPFLLKEIEKNPDFKLKKQEIKPLLSLASLIGRAPEQALDFLKKDVEPYLAKQKRQKTPIASVDV